MKMSKNTVVNYQRPRDSHALRGRDDANDSQLLISPTESTNYLPLLKADIQPISGKKTIEVVTDGWLS